MHHLLWALPAVLLAGCAATAPTAYSSPEQSQRSPGPSSLELGAATKARDALKAIPPEAALERFELLNAKGQRIAYAALTEGEPGGIVFVDDVLTGTLTRPLARAFHACRGYASVAVRYWGAEGDAWSQSLVNAAQPATQAQLHFSGRATGQSIRSIVENPLVDQVQSLVSMGTNPLNIVKTLGKTRKSMKVYEEDLETLRVLTGIDPGDSDSELTVAPVTVDFVGSNAVLGYPKFSLELFARNGRIDLLQQPSFYQLARDRTTLFYAPGVDWSKCSPEHWQQAMPQRVQ